VCLLLVCLVAPACGKKGPPLPPLVKLPVAPAELTAERRAATVDVEFTVPAANTDNSRPANISRVEVYAITGPATLTDQQVLKYGTRIATVPVKAPRDPDQTIEEDETDADIEPPEGKGLDQGVRAHVSETLTPEAFAVVDPSADPKAKPPALGELGATVDAPLLPPLSTVTSRSYLGVPITTRGKKGALSKRAAVPLVPPPPPPSSPTISYDERAVAVRWKPVNLSRSVQPPASADELPSSPIGMPAPAVAYNVYDTGSLSRLTRTPTVETEFSDPRIVWGERRCYTVRTVETIGALTIESDAPDPVCETLEDTFPPAAPVNLQSSPGEGSINLIWDANTESDLAGYLVFRGVPGGSSREGGDLQQVTPAPIPEATFRDAVQPGVVYAYAVKAVDRSGNVSPESARVQETAR
jgi:hypothetical protein